MVRIHADSFVHILRNLTYTYEGHTPASALFATNALFKREGYRASEFAPRILADNGLPVVMKVLYCFVFMCSTHQSDSLC